MKRIYWSFKCCMHVICILCAGAGFSQDLAEDLWGEKIDVRKVISGRAPVVIVPFSSSNCGYCMIDGYFIEENYIGNNERHGGKSFHMSLFNPQLDVYSFRKRFKWKGTILTSPVSLHKYHEDGFPTLLAFKGGKQVLKEFYNYSNYDTLKILLWDTNTRLVPTGEKHIADAFIYENRSGASVIVYPKGADIPDELMKIARKNDFSCKHMDELNEGDMQKHLKLKGGFDFSALRDFFPENSVPVSFKDNSIVMGEYSFSFDSTGIYCCFPSPFNKEKYIVLEQTSPNSKVFWQVNYLDYVLFTGTSRETAKRMLYGHFNKETDYQWKFDDNTAFSDVDRSKHCLTLCKIPEKKRIRPNPSRTIPVSFQAGEDRDQWTMGNDNCRFPEIAAGPDGTMWVTWEENGDIGLVSIDKNNGFSSWFVENDESDSYDPQVIASGQEVWVFYLNDLDGYYRLYGRSFDGSRFSDVILISEKGPFDVVTPDAAADGRGEVTVAWAEWKANYRYLMFRQIEQGVLKDTRRFHEASSVYVSDYINAWYPSLSYDGKSELYGAWNQHYPATFCVCGGRAGDTAVSVTMTADQMDDRENGGYPCLFTGKDQHLFVVWESFAWDVLDENMPQRIKIAEYNDETKSWTMGRVISMDSQTKLCQTPVGTCDGNGNMKVAWSGRPHDESRPWGLYLAREDSGKWSLPVRLSGDNDNDRHPKIAVDTYGRTWISCHSGTGRDMRVKLIRLKKE